MKVYDCFCFFNEIDILEARLNLLDEKVDYFVISEAEYTHSGKYKGFGLEIHKKRLSKWWKKIKHVKVYEKGLSNDTWFLENIQRNKILEEIRPDDEDIILISDIDEIPYPSKIPDNISPGRVISFLQNMRFFFIDCAVEDHLIWENGTRAVCFLTIKNNLLKERASSYDEVSFRRELNKMTTLTKIRLYRHVDFIFDGGYHFSWMGGVDSIIKKILATPHQEINTDKRRNRINIENNLGNGIDPISGKKIIKLKETRFENTDLENLFSESFFLNKLLTKEALTFKIRTRKLYEIYNIWIRNLLRKFFD